MTVGCEQGPMQKGLAGGFTTSKAWWLGYRIYSWSLVGGSGSANTGVSFRPCYSALTCTRRLLKNVRRGNSEAKPNSVIFSWCIFFCNL